MLKAILKEIRTAAHVGKLFAALGYTEDDLPFFSGAITVARWKGFRVIAADREDSRDGVRELTTKVCSANERALVAVVSRDRELAIAAPKFGHAGITRLLVVSLENPSSFALQQLERLRPSRSANALSHALSVADVLSSEELGHQFFKTFKKTLERMAESIESRKSADDRRMVALLALSRILFLYFVQEKGWLDGRRDYLKDRLDTTLARRRSFHRSILHPLFFGTLNQPPALRKKNVRLGAIPYLNGGLFDQHPAERRIGNTGFSNDIWRDAFDGLFERFRFSVREADEVDAIAPDMLGRVFERLMNPDERAETGTFYTPESVVRQIVTATIETALTHELPHHVVRQLVSENSVDKEHAQSVRKALQRIRVLDPAVGSGAFLLEVLHLLSRLRGAVEHCEKPCTRLRLRREVLKNNLMGIDLNPVAVRLAELRLWLAVVADDPTTDINKVTPLPNLDGVVRQGDTLLDPLGAIRSFYPNAAFFSTDAAASVRAARQALFDTRGHDFEENIRLLRHSEIEVAQGILDSAYNSMTQARGDLSAAARSKDLFGKRTGLSPEQRERWQTLKRVRRELDKAREQLSDGALPFFSFEVHAPDILAGGGFTAVVGNPPWVRAEQLSDCVRSALRERFQWWKTNSQRGFAHLPDLSVAFLERCLELTRKGGAVGLLLPSKVFSAGYGETARRGVVSETSVVYVHRVSDREAARFGATTYPIAVVVRKESAPRNHKVKLGFDSSGSVKQQSLDVPGPWILLPKKARDALEEFRCSGTPLGEVAPPMLGVKTGADGLFVGRIVDGDADVAVIAFPGRQATIERGLLREVLRGRDVRRFRSTPRRVIVWCHDDTNTPVSTLPYHAALYFDQRSKELRARSDYRGGPFWTVFRTGCVAKKHRIVWPDIAQRPRAVALDEPEKSLTVPLNTCYVATMPDRETALAMTAVMNSTWAAAFIAEYSDEARGGYRRINASVAQQLPVPNKGSRRAVLAQLTKRIQEDEGDSDEELDEAVADTLRLSKQTRRMLRALAHNSG